MSVMLSRQPGLVIHVVTSLDFGGVEKHMEILARSAVSSVKTHCFCAIGGGGAAERRLNALKQPVDCLGESTSIPSFRAICRLARLFRRLRPEVVHTHGAEANFHGLIAAWFAGVPVRVGEEIGMPSHSARARFVFRQAYRTASCVIGVSDAVKDYLIAAKEVPPSRALRLYNPVLPINSTIVNLSDASSRDLRLCHVGRLDQVKNIPLIMEAMATLAERGRRLELWLIGDGPQRDELVALSKVLDLQEAVRFLGYQNEPEQFLSECDVFVQVSWGEGFGLAMVEAMSMALPVIMTSVGGCSEIVTAGEHGWLVAPTDKEGMVGALEEAVSCRGPRLRAMGEKARSAVVERFTPKVYMQQLDAIYDGLLNEVR